MKDLVEAEIRCQPLYPDEPGNLFNEGFFLNSANALTGVVPGAEPLAPVIRLIRVVDVAPGKTVTIPMKANTTPPSGI